MLLIKIEGLEIMMQFEDKLISLKLRKAALSAVPRKESLNAIIVPLV